MPATLGIWFVIDFHLAPSLIEVLYRQRRAASTATSHGGGGGGGETPSPWCFLHSDGAASAPARGELEDPLVPPDEDDSALQAKVAVGVRRTSSGHNDPLVGLVFSGASSHSTTDSTLG